MASYDEKLLAAAPEVTKADLQDGYNPDLLREPTVKRTLSARAAPTPPRSNSDPHQYPMRDLESSATPLRPKEAPYDTTLGRKKKPFWRTKKGIIVLAFAFIAIILAAVLGGVLGSKKKGKSGSSNNSNGQTGQGGSTESTAGAPTVSGTGDAGNGAGSVATVTSAGIDPNQPATGTARPTTSATQEVGGTPTGSSGNGSAGAGSPTTGDTGAQTGTGGGNGGNGGTGGTALGIADAPPSVNPNPTEGQSRDASTKGNENVAGQGLR